MPVTLQALFSRIGQNGPVTKPKIEAFLEKAGVSNSWLMPKASLAATAIMDKFDDGTGSVGWDSFRKRGMALVPAGLVGQVTDPSKMAAEVDKRWGDIDKAGKGAVDESTLKNFIEAQLVAQGKSFAGTKAEAGAQVLLHALDANGDQLLQKEELKGFLVDAATEAKRG
jgi:hypothetical protein